MKINRDLLSLTKAEISDLFSELKQPKYRGTRLFCWLHQKRVSSFDEMSDFPKELREELARDFRIGSLETVRAQHSSDGTVKFLYKLFDGNMIETVAMRYNHGVSVCVSTQVGCRMGCAFCASTKNGLVRSLEAGEILSQIYATERQVGERVDSVVLMGIGEPLDNFDNVLRFVDLVTDPDGYNLSNRAIALSTCGIVPRIDELSTLKKQLTLSVSLHAATDEQRSEIMPINKSYQIAELMAACERYFAATKRRISFEYAVIHDKNDTERDADNLARLLKGTASHVNLIPINPISETDFFASREHAVSFQKKLIARGINATVRRTLGKDISAACGQLRREAQ